MWSRNILLHPFFYFGLLKKPYLIGIGDVVTVFFPDGSLKSKEKCLVIIFVRNFQNLFLRFFSPCVSLRVLSYIKFVLYLSNVKFAANFAFTRVYTFYFSFFSIYFSFIPKSLQFKFCLIVIVCCFFRLDIMFVQHHIVYTVKLPQRPHLPHFFVLLLCSWSDVCAILR